MDSADLQVLTKLNEWHLEGRHCYLVTLLSTLGSAPRSPGSLLAISEEGDMVGSVSGGCIEDNLLERVREQPSKTPQRLRFGVNTEEAQRFRLPCGGNIEVLLEPIGEQSQIAALCKLIEEQKKVIRQIDAHTGKVILRTIDDYHPKILDEDNHIAVVFGPRYRLFIIGANHIGVYLADMAKALDYQVLVCDPREEVRRHWPLHDPLVSTMMPDDFIREHRPDPHTAIVAVTHDLKQDDLALLEALISPAFFVGAVGSRKTQQARRERLISLALSVDQVNKLKGPVGLAIGSKTPPEIALAILAQITAIKNGAVVS